MKITDGIINEAEFCPSPNFDNRSENSNIDLFVIHAISLPEGNYNTQLIKDLFLNDLDPGNDKFLQSIEHLKVSSHFLISRSGSLIQFVPIDKRAWHAGKSNYQGRENCNDFSIGIELEGCDSEEFTSAQYESLSNLISHISADLKINKKNIVGHNEIAPGRKTDPGPYFDWDLLEYVRNNIDSTYTEQLIDQPDEIINISIGYDYKGFSGRLSMLHNDNVLVAADFWPELRQNTDTYRRWDLSLKQTLPVDGLEMFFNASNLTESNDVSRYRGISSKGDNLKLEQYYGKTIDFGFRYKF